MEEGEGVEVGRELQKVENGGQTWVPDDEGEEGNDRDGGKVQVL